MKLLEFINKESNAPKAKIVFMATLAGISTGLLLAIINVAAENVSNQQSQPRFFLFYLIAFVLFIYAQKYSQSQAIIAVEEVIRKVRVRIANKIRHSELLFIENTGRAEMYTRLTQDSNLISQSALILLNATQSVVVVVFSFGYLLWLSPISVFMTCIFTSLTVLLYLSHDKKVSDNLRQTIQKDAEFFDLFNHLLDGFKELKINRRKSDDLFNYIKTVSRSSEKIKVDVGILLIIDAMFSQVSLYLLLATLVFILPSFSPTHSEVIFKVTATLLFITGPLSMIVGSMSLFTRTGVAVENILELEAQLDAAALDGHQDQPSDLTVPDFKEFRLEEATFHYTDKFGKSLFSVGTINLTIKKGEILFIVGGNGSGKSTLLKLLIGLYYPATGCIYLDNEEIVQTNYQSYRELFSIIFTDYHLFDRLYGSATVDQTKLEALLRLMELDKKTKYIDGKFTNINLSTGQKKRLGFITAILEDKPVYIFDEWAADQDPTFRKYFYEVLLKDLRKQGKTIIAVTHDDKYFNTADRVLKMEDGKLVDYDDSLR